MLALTLIAAAAAAQPTCWANGARHRLEGRVRTERSLDRTQNPPRATTHPVMDLDRPICMSDRRMGTVRHVRTVALKTRGKSGADWPVGRHAAITGEVWQSLVPREMPEKVILYSQIIAPGR